MESITEEIIDLAQRLPVIQRAVLNMIMLGFTQVEIAELFGVRKNTISSIKMKARNYIKGQYTINDDTT